MFSIWLQLWQTRINIASREHHINYSTFMHQMATVSMMAVLNLFNYVYLRIYAQATGAIGQ